MHWQDELVSPKWLWICVLHRKISTDIVLRAPNWICPVGLWWTFRATVVSEINTECLQKAFYFGCWELNLGPPICTSSALLLSSSLFMVKCWRTKLVLFKNKLRSCLIHLYLQIQILTSYWKINISCKFSYEPYIKK